MWRWICFCTWNIAAWYTQTPLFAEGNISLKALMYEYDQCSRLTECRWLMYSWRLLSVDHFGLPAGCIPALWEVFWDSKAYFLSSCARSTSSSTSSKPFRTRERAVVILALGKGGFCVSLNWALKQKLFYSNCFDGNIDAGCDCACVHCDLFFFPLPVAPDQTHQVCARHDQGGLWLCTLWETCYGTAESFQR